MTRAAKALFDPKLFLAKVGEGKAILKFDKNQAIFAQGDVADTVFYIRDGGSVFPAPVKTGDPNGR